MGVIFKNFLKDYSLLSENLTKESKSLDEQDTKVEAPKAKNKNIKNKKSTYNPPRKRNLYRSNKLFKISRNKLESFLRCQRCFYIDRKLGIDQPSGPVSFRLANAVDGLLKKEFGTFRELENIHPICVEKGLNIIPFKHADVEKWQSSGIFHYLHNTNLKFYGKLDDVWIDQNTKELIIVDYKTTSKKERVLFDTDIKNVYKRQVEIYQWLLRKNGFSVSNIAYFFYCNAKKDSDSLNKKLDFDITLVSYEGDDAWVEDAVYSAYQCLNSESMPPINDDCNYCKYWQALIKIQKN